MAVNLSSFAGAGAQFFNGNMPLSGGLIYTYLAGTTTPATTYTTNLGTVAWSNPIVLNSDGKTTDEIWLTDGVVYKFVLKTSADVQLGVYDNISGINDVNASAIPFLQSGTGAVERSVQSKLRDIVSVKDFGAVGDGVTDDTAAIQAAITKCQTNLESLFFPAGVYKITSTITLAGPGNKGISLIGDQGSAQQGSTRPAVTLRWFGGAAPMFNVQGTFYQFHGMAVDNFGSATDFLYVTHALHMRLDMMSFDVGSGATRFSRSIIRCDGPWMGYSIFSNCYIISPAPKFLDYDGGGTSSGVTPIKFDNCIVESGNGGSHTLIYIKDVAIDIITLSRCTFNSQLNQELCVINSTDTPKTQACFTLNVTANEFDVDSNVTNDRMFRLTNFPNVIFTGNQIQGGGYPTAFAELVNSTVSKFEGNHVARLDGPVFNADSTSLVYSTINYLDQGNTTFVVNPTATTSGVIPMPYGTDVIVKGGLGVGSGPTVYQVSATSTGAFNLNIAKPTDSTNKSFMTKGQVFAVQVRNTSGGTISIVPESVFRLAGGNFPAPSNGNNRTVWFVWDGANAIETGRTPQDVPNSSSTQGAFDYAEGTWTPALRGSGTAGTYETASVSGVWTKTGRIVTVHWQITLAGTVTGGGTGFAVVTGLPFNSATTANAIGSCILSGVNYTAGAFVVPKIRSLASPNIIFQEMVSNTGVNDMAISAFGANDFVQGTLTYMV
jgi:hypothetical protein